MLGLKLKYLKKRVPDVNPIVLLKFQITQEWYAVGVLY